MALEDTKDENVSSVEPASDASSEHADEKVANKESVAAPSESTAEVVKSEGIKGDIPNKVVKPINQYSDLEKAQYAFHRQFAKQNKKHAEEMAEMRKLVESLQEETIIPISIDQNIVMTSIQLTSTLTIVLNRSLTN